MKDKIAIIDCDSIAFSIGHPNKVLDEFGTPLKESGKFIYIDKTYEELTSSADYWMYTILKKSGATHYIAYIKGKNTTSKRLAINPDYKSNRKKETPVWWIPVKEYLIERWNVLEVHDIEVDDAVRITKNKLHNSFIIAIDKDLLSLEGKSYNWKKDEWVITTKEEADIHFWSDMICGQPGDGLKGLPKKGESFFKKLKISCINENLPLYLGVFRCYIEHYGQVLGIEEFYKHFKCLHIVDEYPNLEIPKPIEYIIEKDELTKFLENRE